MFVAAILQVCLISLNDQPRAVLVNGFFADEKDWIPNSSAELTKCAAVLRSAGYLVQEFASPVNDLAGVQRAMNGASIFMYWGHGIDWSVRMRRNPGIDQYGGMKINGKYVTPQEIRQHVRFAPSAWVILPNSCWSDGFSNNGPSLLNTTRFRTASTYASAFFDAGAQVYIAGVVAEPLLKAVFKQEAPEKVLMAGTPWAREILQEQVGQDTFYFAKRRINPEGHSSKGLIIWKKR